MTIRRELLNEIISHCKETYPNEACGILAGRENIIEKVYRITNISNNSQVTYEMESAEHLRCEKEINAEGLKIVGIYHSHPSSSAYPSQIDVMRAYWPGDPDILLYPDACYMIIGPVDNDIETRVFEINSGHKIREIELIIT